MCGQFNERIATEAIAQLQPLQHTSTDLILITVGLRVIGPLEEAGYSIETCLPMPGAIGGITSMVQELLLHIET
jgi:F-type H+-transporting ATPase subunit gamma